MDPAILFMYRLFVCLLLTELLLQKEVLARPNLVLIVADDLDRNLGTTDAMPNLHRTLVQQGLTVSDYFVTNALCAPSRATLLRGQYTHSHEVGWNQAPSGGFERFLRMGHEASTVATWLQGSGYRTMLVGKYLNQYPEGGNRTHLPPGWTEFISPIDDEAYKGFDYRMNENGRIVSYGRRPHDYLTDVLLRKTEDVLRRSRGAPFFLYLAPYAPHHPAAPAPRHDRLFASAQVPRTPSFNEDDVSDKPAPRSALAGSEIENIDLLYRSRLQSMQAVDEMIARVVQILENSGQLGDTFIFFVSDNGFHMGQHRLRPQKATPYEEDVRVPLIVRGPGVPRGETLSGYLAGNVDSRADSGRARRGRDSALRRWTLPRSASRFQPAGSGVLETGVPPRAILRRRPDRALDPVRPGDLRRTANAPVQVRGVLDRSERDSTTSPPIRTSSRTSRARLPPSS